MDAISLPLCTAATQIAYGAECRRCKIIVRVDLEVMARRLGPQAQVRDIRPRLRCSRCGSRDPIICTLWLSQTATAAMVEGWVSAPQRER